MYPLFENKFSWHFYDRTKKSETFATYTEKVAFKIKGFVLNMNVSINAQKALLQRRYEKQNFLLFLRGKYFPCLKLQFLY
jgi:hypothetical protein